MNSSEQIKCELTDDVRMEGLSFSVAKRDLLKSVSLKVKKGSMTALLGANGAGKTTLLKCLLGMLKPHAGRIDIHGKGLKLYSRKSLAKELAYVPQLLETNIDFTVLDFVLMGRYAYEGGFAYSDEDGLKCANRALERVNMLDFSDRSIQTLSGGERQKVCLAAALAQQASILLLDEPSAHLDPHQREEIHSLLSDIAKCEGLSVLTVTHDLNWAAMDYDYLYGMKNGEIVAEGSVSEMITSESLYKIFGVEFTMVPHPVTQTPMVVPSARKEPRC